MTLESTDETIARLAHQLKLLSERIDWLEIQVSALLERIERVEKHDSHDPTLQEMSGAEVRRRYGVRT